MSRARKIFRGSRSRERDYASHRRRILRGKSAVSKTETVISTRRPARVCARFCPAAAVQRVGGCRLDRYRLLHGQCSAAEADGRRCPRAAGTPAVAPRPGFTASVSPPEPVKPTPGCAFAFRPHRALTRGISSILRLTSQLQGRTCSASAKLSVMTVFSSTTRISLRTLRKI